MKFIALKDFAKVKGMECITITEPIHPNHIHEGAEFEIGTAATLEKLKEGEPEKAKLAAQLIRAECIGDAGDAGVRKKVEASLAERASRESNAAKANARTADLLIATRIGQAFAHLITNAQTQ